MTTSFKDLIPYFPPSLLSLIIFPFENGNKSPPPPPAHLLDRLLGTSVFAIYILANTRGYV